MTVMFKSWQFIATILKETWYFKWPKIKAVITNHLEIVGSDRQGGWGVEWKDDRMNVGGGAEDEVMCLHKALKPGVRSCSWKPSGQLNVSHTKYSAHDSPFYILLPSLSVSAHFFPLHSSLLPKLPLLSTTLPFLPHCFFSSFSLSKRILLINAWQLQGAVLLHFSMATVSLFQQIPFQFW